MQISLEGFLLEKDNILSDPPWLDRTCARPLPLPDYTKRFRKQPVNADLLIQDKQHTLQITFANLTELYAMRKQLNIIITETVEQLRETDGY